MSIQKDKIVEMHYTLKLDDGQVRDTSDGREPLKFLCGHGQIIPGLENELIGLKEGEEKTVRVAPEDGYGKKSEDMIHTVPLDQLPREIDPRVGEKLQAQTPEGHMIVGTITKVRPENVDIDFNHELADEHLNFNVKVVSVRDASNEELAHGHAH